MARFIVNHGGVVHIVNDEDFATHLGQASIKPSEQDPAGKPAREASREEIEAFCAEHGIASPFASDGEPASEGEPAKSGRGSR